MHSANAGRRDGLRDSVHINGNENGRASTHDNSRVRRRCWIIAACVAAQLLVLAYMVYGRESVIHNGTRISIATAPIDPRAPFRGDYVRLRFGLNSLEYAPVRWQPSDHVPEKGEKIYAVLEPRPGGLHDVSYFTNVKPEASGDSQPLYLRGRIEQSRRWTGFRPTDVRFGIEQLFVEQGSGIDIEERRGIRGGMQNAMYANVSVGDDGTAVLTGYSWSPLAIGLEVTNAFLPRQEALTPADAPSSTDTSTNGNSTGNTNSSTTVDATGNAVDSTNGSTIGNAVDSTIGETQGIDDSDHHETPEAAPSAPSLIVTVSNVSDDSITLNNPGDDCGFSLEPVARHSSHYFVPENVCADLSPHPVTLAAGESLVLEIDLSSPRWYMSLPIDDIVTTGDIRLFTGNTEWFRVVYRSEDQGDTAFWQGDLASQAFNATGRVD